MKIAYINPTFLIRRPITELIENFSNKHEITVLIPTKIRGKFEEKWHNDKALNKAKKITYTALNLPGNFEWPIPFSLSLFFKLHKIFKKNDVVHIWTYFYLYVWIVKFYSLFYKTKVIMSCDTFPGESFKLERILSSCFKIYTTLFGWFLFSDKVHLYSKEMIPFAKKTGVKNYEVIPTGINLNKFNVKKFKFNYKRPIIFFAGLMVPRKGIDIILSIAKKVQGTFVLAGEGPNYSKYKKNACKNIKFLGWRKDIPSLIKGSDIIILPSRGEGLPGIVMEAMACSKPVVASDIIGNRELVQGNGFLCNCEEDYIKAINKAYKEKNKLGKLGRNKIEQYSWDKLIDKYEDMYSS